jgi:hypothetical protein
MKKKLAKSQFNWLWKLAILFYCQFLICQLFIENTDLYTFKYDENNLTSPYIYIILFIFIAPIIEEFIYRGVSRKNKITIAFSVIFYLGSTLMLFNTGIKIWWIFLITTPIITVFAIKRANNNSKISIVIYSTLLFAISHFNNESTIVDFALRGGNYMGAGLFLSWIVINFTLLKSILFHLIYNVLVFSIFTFFTNKIYIEEIYDEKIVYKIEETSFLQKSKSISRTSNRLIAEQANISVILAHLDLSNYPNVYIKSPLSKFDIYINDNVDKLQDKEILEILINTKIIQFR